MDKIIPLACGLGIMCVWVMIKVYISERARKKRRQEYLEDWEGK